MPTQRTLARISLSVLAAVSLFSALQPAFAQPMLIPQAPQAIEELPVTTEPVFEDVADIQTRVLNRWRDIQASGRIVPREKIQKLLNDAGDILKGGYQQEHTKFKQAQALLVEAQVLMMPSRPVEMRGVLIDADMIGVDPAALGRLLDKLKAAGFNAVFPEVFRRGYALFPNRVAEVDPLYLKRGIDGLQMVTEQAQARGLQVYPWLWTFRVFSPSASTGNPVFDRLPALISPQLNKPASNEGGEGLEDESAAFVSPASPEWRQLLSMLVSDLARTYPVQGFLLDYIRYGNNATSDQLSQTQFNMEYFRKVGSFPPKPLDPASDLYAEWHLWREEQVSRMLQQIRLSMAETRPGLSLGTAVFRNEVSARNTKMQNWRYWSDNNWVDFVSPMLYANSASQLDLWLDWESDQRNRRDMLYPILGLQSLRTPGELFNQLGLLQSRHIPGVELFAVRRLDDRTLSWLQQGPFRQPAEVPHLNLLSAVRRQLNSTADWLNSLSQNNPTDSKTSLASAFKARAGSLDTNQLDSQLQALREQSANAGLAPEMLKEVSDQLAYARALAGILSEHKSGTVKPPTRPPDAVRPEARALPSLQIPFLAQAPQIDGELSEPAWQPAATIPTLWWSSGSGRAQVGTQLRLGYDNNALYLGFNNEEPRLDRIKASFRGSSEQLPSSGDDTIDVFLSPGNQPQKYYYFVVNPANSRFAKASFDSSWRGDWQSQTTQNGRGWRVEMKIPFSSLRVPAGGSWRGNFCRRRPQEIAPYHCWSMTFGGVHRVDRFGSLQFSPQPPTSPVPQASSPALNGP